MRAARRRGRAHARAQFLRQEQREREQRRVRQQRRHDRRDAAGARARVRADARRRAQEAGGDGVDGDRARRTRWAPPGGGVEPPTEEQQIAELLRVQALPRMWLTGRINMQQALRPRSWNVAAELVAGYEQAATAAAARERNVCHENMCAVCDEEEGTPGGNVGMPGGIG